MARCLVFIFTTLLTIMIVYFQHTVKDPHWYYKKHVECRKSADTLDDLVVLAENVHMLLDRNHIKHFMCFGTLWGAIRKQTSLPWDTDLDFCVMNEDIAAVEEPYLYSQFRWENLGIQFSSRFGSYTIRYGQATADLILYELSPDGIWLQKVGWENRIFSNIDNHKIPVKLVENGLTSMKFHGLNLPAPYKPMEVQKYLYPDDWWMEVKPPGC